jgi:hypothetical protein
MATTGVVLGMVLAIGGGAQAKRPSPAPVVYSSHVTFSAEPTGGGYEGRGQKVTVKITSSKAACRQNRPFKLDLESLDGYVEETHIYRTNAAGSWTLEIVALPSAPTRVSVKVPPKRLDGTHRCLGTSTTVPLS